MLAIPSAIAQPGKLSNIARHCPRGGGTSAANLDFVISRGTKIRFLFKGVGQGKNIIVIFSYDFVLICNR